MAASTSFEGISLPLVTTEKNAEILLRRFVAKPDRFKLEKNGDQLLFKL